MNILVTGFEQFGKYKLNPTEQFCNEINNTKLGEHSIYSHVLSTQILDHNGKSIIVDEILKCIKLYKIDIVASFGMASDVRGIRIESAGFNEINNSTYALSHEDGKIIEPHGSLRIECDLDSRNISGIIGDCVENGLCCEDLMSQDPGRYCCNALIYSYLYHMNFSNNYIPFIFAHCSCTVESIYEGFDPSKKLILQEDLIKYLTIIVRNFTPQP